MKMKSGQQNYKNTLNTLKHWVAVKTENNVFVSHAGRVKWYKYLDDIREIDLLRLSL
jgi:hypothetical protein